MNLFQFPTWAKILIGSIFLFLLWKFISIWPWLILFGISYLPFLSFKKKISPSDFSRHAPVHLPLIALLASLSIGEIALRAMRKNACYHERGKNIFSQILFTSYTKPFEYQKGLLKYKPYERNVGSVNTEFRYVKPTNSLGYVDREWEKKKKKKYRFIFLGDSFTEGVGAPIDSSYVNAFRQMVGDSIEVYNAGISGSDPCSQYMLFKEEILVNYKPDRIYVALNGSDIADVMTHGGLERFGSAGEMHLKKSPWWICFYAQSYLVRLYIHQYVGLDWQFNTPEQSVTERKSAIEKIEKCLDSFQDLANQNGINCVFIFHPFPDEVIAQSMNVAPILEYAKQKNYPTINILNTFIKKGVDARNIDKYFWFVDRHNNSLGYQLFAEGLMENH